RAPVELLLDQLVVGVAAAHAERAGDMADRELLSGDRHDELGEAVDRHHLLRANIDRPREARAHQARAALQALVDVEERSGLLAVAPDLDLATRGRLGHFAAERRRRLFLAVVPGPQRAEDVVEAREAHLHPFVALIGQIDPLAEELLPAVLAV